MPQLVKQGVRTCKSGQLLLSGVCAFPKAVDQAQLDRNAKNAAYAVPNQVREQVKAKNKQTAPVAPSAGWWEQAKDIFFRYAPLGLAPAGSGNVGEEAIIKPAVKKVVESLPSVDLGWVLRWGVVGLVAIALIVVVPRIIR